MRIENTFLLCISIILFTLVDCNAYFPGDLIVNYDRSRVYSYQYNGNYGPPPHPLDTYVKIGQGEWCSHAINPGGGDYTLGITLEQSVPNTWFYNPGGALWVCSQCRLSNGELYYTWLGKTLVESRSIHPKLNEFLSKLPLAKMITPANFSDKCGPPPNCTDTNNDGICDEDQKGTPTVQDPSEIDIRQNFSDPDTCK